MLNASAVGTTPRYTNQPVADAGATATSRTSPGVNGRHTTAPIAHDRNVTCNGGSLRTVGFCASTPIA